MLAAVLLPDVEIDLVALLKKLDPRIQFPLGFPNPYNIRLVRRRHIAGRTVATILLHCSE